jgi:hypothetical protein
VELALIIPVCRLLIGSALDPEAPLLQPDYDPERRQGGCPGSGSQPDLIPQYQALRCDEEPHGLRGEQRDAEATYTPFATEKNAQPVRLIVRR